MHTGGQGCLPIQKGYRMNKKLRTLRHKERERKLQHDQPASAPLTAGADDVCYMATGEIFQPIRLYYEALKPTKIFNMFGKLKCLALDKDQTRWNWLYSGETSHLKFRKRILDFKPPLVLGVFSFDQERKLWLDLFSIERALTAITFFDKHLPRNAAKLWYFSVVNRLFSLEDAQRFDPAQHFDAALEFRDPAEALTAQLLALSEQARNENEKMELLQRFFAQRNAAPTQEVEHGAIRFYDEGLTPLQIILNTRQQVALQHWKGNVSYTRSDYLQELAENVKLR